MRIVTRRPYRRTLLAGFISPGFTLVEMVVAIAITGIILAALGFFIVRVFRLPPQYVEQGSITAEARVELARMSDVLRGARVDATGAWLAEASPCSIEVVSNVDADSDPETVRYLLDDGPDPPVLSRAVDGAVETLATSVRNDCTDPAEQLFTYYSLGGGQALQVDPAVSGLAVIDRVVIRLIVDVDEAQPPEAGEFVTVVTPRRGI
jgi:prepilin-type N-terminal cleavage/methylation domain-containing protein